MARPSPLPPRFGGGRSPAGDRRRRPARTGRRRGDAASASRPGPWSTTWISTQRAVGRPAGATGAAGCRAARRRWRWPAGCRAPGPADRATTSHPQVRRLAHQLDVVLLGDRSPGVEALGDGGADVDDLTVGPVASRRSARARVSSPSISRDSRWVSRRAPARSSSGLGAGDLGLEVLEPQAQRGERACAAGARRRPRTPPGHPTSSSSRPAISSKAAATSRTSGGPGAGPTRALRSPWPSRTAAPRMGASGLGHPPRQEDADQRGGDQAGQRRWPASSSQ